MNTNGAVVGGAVGAVAGGLGGYFAAHAMRAGRKKMHMAGYSLGGALLVGALGAFIGGQTQGSPQLAPPAAPSQNQQTSSFWSSLSPLQQGTYKSALFNWGTSATSDGTYPGTVQSMSDAGIDTVANLDDPSNLALLTDAYQTANNVGAAGAGVVDQATYHAVTGQ